MSDLGRESRSVAHQVQVARTVAEGHRADAHDHRKHGIRINADGFAEGRCFGFAVMRSQHHSGVGGG